MNREAAALGVPVYSIFRGKTGAVDQYLQNKKRLIMIETREDVHTQISLKTRKKEQLPENLRTETVERIVEKIVSVVPN